MGLPKDATTANISTVDIDDSCTASPRQGQQRTFRRDIRTFFAWASVRGLSPGNPAKNAATFKAKPGKIGILTPEDASPSLEACHPSILPGVVIGMFCGLRQSEIARMDWRAVDLASGILTVGAEIAKTSSRRTVEIPENARAWLAPYAKESGPVWPASEEARNLWNLASIEAGFGPFFSTRTAVNAAQAGRDDLRPWPDNALRHSAISYRLALTRDLPVCDRGGQLSRHRPTALCRACQAGYGQEVLWHPADRGCECHPPISMSRLGDACGAEIIMVGRKNPLAPSPSLHTFQVRV